MVPLDGTGSKVRRAVEDSQDNRDRRGNQVVRIVYQVVGTAYQVVQVVYQVVCVVYQVVGTAYQVDQVV